MLGTWFAHEMGKTMATNQRGYVVFAKEPEIAVIRIYGDTIIAVPFDLKTKTIRPQIIIRKIATDELMLTV
jgi:hypothetical protein